VIFHLNLLHLVLVVGAAGAVYFALREVRGQVMRSARFARLPLVASVVALVLLLFQLAAHTAPWTFTLPLGLGLAGGALRGITMKLEVDQNYRLARPTGRRVLFWVSLALPVAVGLEIAGALYGRSGAPLRLAAAHLAILCTGLLIGRALVLAMRLARAPHVDLRR
jgi:hypothetical protein